jgi:hypothetical protein
MRSFVDPTKQVEIKTIDRLIAQIATAYRRQAPLPAFKVWPRSVGIAKCRPN